MRRELDKQGLTEVQLYTPEASSVDETCHGCIDALRRANFAPGVYLVRIAGENGIESLGKAALR
jgi:hypothetical protein